MIRELAGLAASALLGGAAGPPQMLAGFPGGASGAVPQGEMAADGAGNLYGVTNDGGAEANGVVFRLARRPGPHWVLTPLLSIPAGAGYGHAGGAAWQGPNVLAGTSVAGGPAGCGAIFAARLGARASLATLHVFTGDGCHPAGGVVAGRGGPVFGVTSAGGAGGAGAIYTWPPPYGETSPVIWSFSGHDGDAPSGPPLPDASGGLAGTASRGGAHGDGTVWTLVPPAQRWKPWQFSVLANFSATTDCARPVGALARDAAGHVFGACQAGGAHGRGGVFALSPPAHGSTSWTLRVIADSDAATGTITSGVAMLPDRRLVMTSVAPDGRARILALAVPASGAKAGFTVLAEGTGLSPVTAVSHVLYGSTARQGAADAGTLWALAP